MKEILGYKYYDKLTIERIKKLHPAIRFEVLELYLFANNNIVPESKRLRFSDTFRSFEEQDRLFNTVPRVTNARGGQSYHNYGLAFDFVILEGKDFKFASYAVDKIWMKIVRLFKDNGFEWGGDWSMGDYPHLQKTFGYSWQELKEIRDKWEIITEYPPINII